MNGKQDHYRHLDNCARDLRRADRRGILFASFVEAVSVGGLVNFSLAAKASTPSSVIKTVPSMTIPATSRELLAD